MERRQDSNTTSTQAGKGGPLAQDRYCARNLRGGAKKRKRIETSLGLEKVVLRVVTYVVSSKLFLN